MPGHVGHLGGRWLLARVRGAAFWGNHGNGISVWPKPGSTGVFGCNCLQDLEIDGTEYLSRSDQQIFGLQARGGLLDSKRYINDIKYTYGFVLRGDPEPISAIAFLGTPCALCRFQVPQCSIHLAYLHHIDPKRTLLIYGFAELYGAPSWRSERLVGSSAVVRHLGCFSPITATFRDCLRPGRSTL